MRVRIAKSLTRAVLNTAMGGARLLQTVGFPGSIQAVSRLLLTSQDDRTKLTVVSFPDQYDAMFIAFAINIASYWSGNETTAWVRQ